MLIDPHWQDRALEAHLMHPTGDVVRLPASRDEQDEPPTERESNRVRACRSHQRLRQYAIALGMTQREFIAARRAGTLPAWAMKRAPYTRRDER